MLDLVEQHIFCDFEYLTNLEEDMFLSITFR